MNGQKIKELDKRVTKLEKKCCCGTPTGPYADDAAAEAGGVPIGGMYYTADGSVKVRLV